MDTCASVEKMCFLIDFREKFFFCGVAESKPGQIYNKPIKTVLIYNGRAQLVSF